MRTWRVKLVHAIAITNAVFVVGGLYFLTDALFRQPELGRFQGPYSIPVFYAQSLLSLVFLTALAVGSIGLWRLSRTGRRVCNAVFVGEIVYFVGSEAFSLAAIVHGGTARLLGLAIGVGGNMGINPQFITGYPVIALVVLNLAFRKMHASG